MSAKDANFSAKILPSSELIFTSCVLKDNECSFENALKSAINGLNLNPKTDFWSFFCNFYNRYFITLIDKQKAKKYTNNSENIFLYHPIFYFMNLPQSRENSLNIYIVLGSDFADELAIFGFFKQNIFYIKTEKFKNIEYTCELISSMKRLVSDIFGDIIPYFYICSLNKNLVSNIEKISNILTENKFEHTTINLPNNFAKPSTQNDTKEIINLNPDFGKLPFYKDRRFQPILAVFSGALAAIFYFLFLQISSYFSQKELENLQTQTQNIKTQYENLIKSRTSTQNEIINLNKELNLLEQNLQENKELTNSNLDFGLLFSKITKYANETGIKIHYLNFSKGYLQILISGNGFNIFLDNILKDTGGEIAEYKTIKELFWCVINLTK